LDFGARGCGWVDEESGRIELVEGERNGDVGMSCEISILRSLIPYENKNALLFSLFTIDILLTSFSLKYSPSFLP